MKSQDTVESIAGFIEFCRDNSHLTIWGMCCKPEVSEMALHWIDAIEDCLPCIGVTGGEPFKVQETLGFVAARYEAMVELLGKEYMDECLGECVARSAGLLIVR